MLEQTNLDDGAESLQEFDHGHITWAVLGEYTAWRLTAEPGWRYSQHLGPLEGNGSCPEDHMLFIVSGRMRTRTDDGDELESGPGDAVRVSPGHDSWTVGQDTLVALGVDRR